MSTFDHLKFFTKEECYLLALDEISVLKAVEIDIKKSIETDLDVFIGKLTSEKVGKLRLQFFSECENLKHTNENDWCSHIVEVLQLDRNEKIVKKLLLAAKRYNQLASISARVSELEEFLDDEIE